MGQCYNKIYLKDKDIHVECGKCLNCLENKKKEKALRLIHEMNNYRFKYFITLTMDDIRATRCKDGRTEVSKRDLNNYIKSLQYYEKKYTNFEHLPLRYIACGEYGDKTDRAHYHIVLLSNTFIQRKIKMNWKRGNVFVENVKDVRAVYYTAGYVDKKAIQTFKKVNEKYKEKENREVAFLKSSRGNGKLWIYEAIASKKINEKNYFVESWNGKNKLPNYYKNIIKQSVMGIKPHYYKLKPEERFYRKLHFGDNRKTIMLNQNTYDKNIWKWEKFIEKVKEINLMNDPIFYDVQSVLKYKDSWKRKLYNLMYNEEYETTDIRERDYSELIERRKELLKIKAEQKMWAKISRREAI